MFKFKSYQKIYRSSKQELSEYLKTDNSDSIFENRGFIHTKNPNLNSTENQIISEAMTEVHSAISWLETFHNGEYSEIVTMLNQCDIIFTSPENKQIETMAVAPPIGNPMGTDRFVLWINPLFVLDQKRPADKVPGETKPLRLPLDRCKKRIAWVLAHEMLHISQKHHQLADTMGYDMTISNLADDYWINLGLSQLPHCEEVIPQSDADGNPIYRDEMKIFRYYTITGEPKNKNSDLGFMFPILPKEYSQQYPNAIGALLDEKYYQQKRLSGDVREIMDEVDIYDDVVSKIKKAKEQQPGGEGGGEGGYPGGEGGYPGGEGGYPGGEPGGKGGQPGGEGGYPGGEGGQPGGKLSKKEVEDMFDHIKPKYKPSKEELKKSTPVKVGGRDPESLDPSDNFKDLEFEGASPGNVGDIIKSKYGFERIISSTVNGIETEPISIEELESIFNNNLKK